METSGGNLLLARRGLGGLGALLSALALAACSGGTDTDSGTPADTASSDSGGGSDTTPTDGGNNGDSTPSDVQNPTDVVSTDVQNPSDVVTPMDAMGSDVVNPMDVVVPPLDVVVPTDVVIPTDGPLPGARVAITTYGYDMQRTAANRQETQLTVAALMANRLGRDAAFTPPTFDGLLYTQPLYVPQLTVMGGTHDVLYVATQNNSIYALDAATGAMLWRTGLGAPVRASTQPCGNIPTQTGVLGGPVIDLASRTLYAVAYTTPTAGGMVYTINALDLTTGAQRAGYPANIAPPASGGSTWTAAPQQERGAIQLVGGRIYVPFGGLWGDCGNYHGWVVGIDTATPSRQTAWATQGRGSGIWGPAGLASDGAYLYAATGNDFNTTAANGLNSNWVVRFAVGAMSPTLSAGTTEYFQPSNYVALDRGDVDLGSTAPVVLPDHAGSSTPHLLFEAGKQGVAYLLNRDNLGGRGTGNGVTGEGVYSAQLSTGGIFGSFASWSDGARTYVFTPVGTTRAAPCTGSGGVMALSLGLTGTRSTFAPVWCTAAAADSTPAVSSNGNADGVLWVTQGGTGNLRAYRLSDGMQVVNLTDAATIRKWVPPVVADGRVFVTGQSTMSMYRLVR